MPFASSNAIRHDGRHIPYRVVHRPAVTRRIHLELDAEGGLQVVAPRRMSPGHVQKSLQRSAARVARFLAEARSRQADLGDLEYADGEEHLYLGRRYPLRVEQRPGQRARIDWNGRAIHIRAPRPERERVRDLLERWYRRQARDHFGQRLEAILGQASWTPARDPSLRLRRMKRTWGNCSVSGRITLNTLLVRAPEHLVDYVIAHEICHLREHHHGPAFYALQQRLYPAWREARDELRARGHLFLHR
jgi:predicted metal-dependent hydrolase